MPSRSRRSAAAPRRRVAGLIARPGRAARPGSAPASARLTSSLVVDLDVEGDRVRAGGDEALDVARRLGDHQVRIDRQLGQAPDGRHDVRPEGHVGHEVAVHDVEVQAVDAGALELAHHPIEIAEVGRRMLAATSAGATLRVRCAAPDGPARRAPPRYGPTSSSAGGPPPPAPARRRGPLPADRTQPRYPRPRLRRTVVLMPAGAQRRGESLRRARPGWAARACARPGSSGSG